MQQSTELSHFAYLHLGSNLGNRLENLKQCLKAMSKNRLNIVRKSYIYETEAWGLKEQNDFLNMAIKIETDLNPFELLILTQKIEKSLGRSKEIKWGPRLIDIDILYFEKTIINLEHLIIPHPHISKRRFVLQPLVDIAENWEDPVSELSIQTMLDQCIDKSKISVFEHE